MKRMTAWLCCLCLALGIPAEELKPHTLEEADRSRIHFIREE